MACIALVTLTRRRALGKEVTIEQKEEALDEMEIFRNWFTENVMKGEAQTASSAVLILPSGRGQPWYRDVPLEVPFRTNGYNSMALAVLLALPQLVVPSKSCLNKRIGTLLMSYSRPSAISIKYHWKS